MIGYKRIKVCVFTFFCLLLVSGSIQAQQKLQFSPNTLQVIGDSIEGIPPNNMMTNYLQNLADKAWVRWKTGFEKRIDEQQTGLYYKKMRDEFISAIGGLPIRTPLNAMITGELHRDNFKVEKIIFESRPKHLVTANLYLPVSAEFKPPYPGVLVPCGHYNAAKAHEEYQSMGALLAINGIAALVYDPIGQGERLQIRDSDGEYETWGTRSHFLEDIRAILLGTSVSQNMIWDGMRALDYLASRPEIDSAKIGCTGNSGGGTQTSYLMALDDRIKAAAPSCYIHHLNSQIKNSMGDGEQNIYGQLQFGMDHPDYLMMRAPTPILILAATKDFFKIDAVWETYRYAKRFYSRSGYSEYLGIFENNAPHNYNHDQRTAALKWMLRWLRDSNYEFKISESELFSEEELRCTPEGQTLLLADALSVQNLHQETLAGLQTKKKKLWQNLNPGQIRDTIRSISNIRPFSDISESDVTVLEKLNAKNYTIEKLILKPEPGIYLPAVYFENRNSISKKTVFYLHEEGKGLKPANINKLLIKGVNVFAVDLRGIGETAQVAQEGAGMMVGLDWEDWYTAYLLGKSYVGMRTEDIYSCVKFLKNKWSSDHHDIELIAIGNIGIPALHAAALEPGIFSRVHIEGCLHSWTDIINNDRSFNQLSSIVRAALTFYDLPDLTRLLAKKVTIENPVNAFGVPLNGGDLKDKLSKEPELSGLAGVWYGSSDLRDPVGADPISLLEKQWDNNSKRGRTWSAEWYGWLKAPWDGNLVVEVSTDQQLNVFLNNEEITQNSSTKKTQLTTRKMKKGIMYPLHIVYNQQQSETGYFYIKMVKDAEIYLPISSQNLFHSPAQHHKMNFSWR